MFTSSLAKSQIAAFISGVLITFILYEGFDAISTLIGNDLSLKQLGIKEHFKSISRGVIDTRDIVYFISTITFFLYLTKIRLDNE